MSSVGNGSSCFGFPYPLYSLYLREASRHWLVVHDEHPAASRRLLQVLLRAAGKVARSFAGADTQGETPDPIPNSEVKSLGPMVVQVGESRLVPVFERPGGRKITGPRLFLPLRFIFPAGARLVCSNPLTSSPELSFHLDSRSLPLKSLIAASLTSRRSATDRFTAHAGKPRSSSANPRPAHPLLRRPVRPLRPNR